MRHKFYCPYCGKFIQIRRINTATLPEEGIRLDCKACGLYYYFWAEDDFAKNVNLNVKVLSNPVLLYCPTCGLGDKKQHKFLKESIDQSLAKEFKNPKFRLHRYHECLICHKLFKIFPQDKDLTEAILSVK